MKQANKCRALSMAFFILLATDCKSSEGIVEISNVTSLVPMVTSEVTSGDKHSLYGFTDKELKAVQFAQINWSNLTADIANGQGEHLKTIADLLRVKNNQKSAFYNVAKSKFRQLFPSTETTPEQLVNHLRIEVANLSKADIAALRLRVFPTPLLYHKGI